MEVQTIRRVLEELGYNLQESGREYRCKPLYRESNNNTSLRIFKDNGSFTDFSVGIKGSFIDLIKLSLGLKDFSAAKKWLENKGVECSKTARRNKIKMKSEKIYPPEILTRLLPHTAYWEKRGVTKQTLADFRGGLATGGKMFRRYVFPIFDKNERIVGFSGRLIAPTQSALAPKWKQIGDKKKWMYPFHLCENEVRRTKRVYLVESIGDMLALWQAGIHNVLVMFGTTLFEQRAISLVSLDLDTVYICNNNEPDNIVKFGDKEIVPAFEGVKKNHKTLSKYFDKSSIVIKLPTKKDFGEMSNEEISAWRVESGNEMDLETFERSING